MPEIAPQTDQATLDLESLTADVVALAIKAGASDAEAVVREGDEFSVSVRMGEVETLKESGSRGLGLRVFLGTRSASTSTSDLTPDGIRQLVDGAVALAKVTEEDPFTGLPDAADFGSIPGDLHLYYEDVYSLAGPERIEWARRCEAAALAADPRITNSDGGASTPQPAARSWPTPAASSEVTAPATPASAPLPLPWTPTARCSVTAGGPAHDASSTLRPPNPSDRRPPAAPSADSARARSQPSASP